MCAISQVLRGEGKAGRRRAEPLPAKGQRVGAVCVCVCARVSECVCLNSATSVHYYWSVFIFIQPATTR